MTLSKIKDAQVFKLAKYSKVTYIKITVREDGIVITSNNSTRSFMLPADTEVFIPKIES